MKPAAYRDRSEDPRRGLGIRPAPTLPRLVLNEGFDEPDKDDRLGEEVIESIKVADTPSISRLETPKLLDDLNKRSRRTIGHRPKEISRPTGAPRGLAENRKLLSHLLDKLEERQAVPDLLELASSEARDTHSRFRIKRESAPGTVEKVLGAAARPGRLSNYGHASRWSQRDDGEDDGPNYAPQTSVAAEQEKTFDLMDQTRGLLALMHKQGLRLFEDDVGLDNPSVPHLESPSTTGWRSALSPVITRGPPSPKAGLSPNVKPMTGTSLYKRLCVLLRGVIMDDSLHQIRSYRPALPPNALQAACLDVAAYLYDNGSPADQIQIIDAVTEGIHTMPSTMLDKILGWLEGRVSGPMSPLLRGRAQSAARGNGLANVTSTEERFSPGETLEHGHVSGVLVKLLTAFCDMLHSDISASTALRIQHLLRPACKTNPRVANDLLQIVATSGAGPRNAALALLHSVWPASMGHNRIAAPIRAEGSTFRDNIDVRTDDRTDCPNHHYLPWRISSHDPLLDPDRHCHVCETEIHGFCVICSMCNERCHIHCLRTPTEVFSFDIVRQSESGRSVKRTVQIKYSQTADADHDVYGRPGASGRHDFRKVNLLTTTSCVDCRQPIWGTCGNAYACVGGCQQLFHLECVHKRRQDIAGPCRPDQHSVIEEGAHEVSHRFGGSQVDLQRSFQAVRTQLCFDDVGLASKSYDEIALLYGSLWLQYKILESGLASGAISLSDDDNTESRDPLGLRPVLKRYDTCLKNGHKSASPALTDFMCSTGQTQLLAQGYLFCRPFLTYCSALLRSPPDTTRAAFENAFLVAHGPYHQSIRQPQLESTDDSPYSAALSALTTDMAIKDHHIARTLLYHLCSVGLCSMELGESSEGTCDVAELERVGFPLPLLMEATPPVEILILAIEVLFEDIDLSHNEQALNLMTRRAWPSLLCSPYALERLGGALISWVMNRDETLHLLIKNYASQNRPLPGVRSAVTAGDAYGGTSSIPLYASDRDRLVTDFAVPWLSALHDQDPELYTHVLYERTRLSPSPRPPSTPQSAQDVALDMAGVALDRFSTALEARIAYSSIPDILVAWLEDLGDLAQIDHAFRLLPRLISHSEDDVWAALKHTASKSPQGQDRVCMWLRTMSSSGVTIHLELVQHLLGASDRLPPIALRNLAIAVNHDDRAGRIEHFARIACELCDRVAEDRLEAEGEAISSVQDSEDALRRSLRLVLKAYGVSEADMQASALALEQEPEPQGNAGISKHRRLTVGPGRIDLPKGTLRNVIKLLKFAGTARSQLVDFVWLLSHKTGLAANVDGFLHDVALELFTGLWPLLSQANDTTRAMDILLRLLSLNNLPLQDFIVAQMKDEETATRDRLLRFALNLVDAEPALRQPTASRGVVGLVLILLEYVFDSRSISSDTLTTIRSLLPTQLAALSRYFSNHLIRSDDETRVYVLGRLVRVHSAVPSWAVIPWETLDDLLAEQVAAVSQMSSWRGSKTGSVLLETQMVRAGLIALGLSMLANGVEISWNAAQRFQQHVASACALPWPVPNDGIVSLILPALRSALDSPHHLSPGGQNRRSVLVGALFVPVVMDFGNELKRHDYMTQRCLLDILHVAIYKQELRTVELAALGALQTIADFAAAPSSTENRLLALRILQTALTRMAAHTILRVSPSIFASIAKAFVGEMTEGGDSAIIESARVVMRSMIDTFGKSGMFVQLFKVDSVNLRWSSDKPYIHRALNVLIDGDGGSGILNTVFVDSAEVFKKDPDGLQDMLGSLGQLAATIEVELSDDAAESLGLLISRVTKSVADADVATFDPDSLLVICRHLLPRLSPVSTPPLLHQMATFLLVALSRLNVRPDTLEGLYSTSGEVAARNSLINTIEMVIFEEATCKGLKDPQMTPLSMTSVIKCILTQIRRSPGPGVAANAMLDASTACMDILSRQHPVYATTLEAETSLDLQSAAAKLLVAADQVAEGLLSRHLARTHESSAQARCDLFVQLVMAGPDRETLSRVCPIIGRSASLCLRAVGDLLSVRDTDGEGADMLGSVFNVIRVVLTASDEHSSSGFWDRIWPDWHRLLTITTEKICVNAPLRTVCQSVFCEAVSFLDSVGSPLLTLRAEDFDDVIAKLEKWMKANSGPGQKKVAKARQRLALAGQHSDRPGYKEIKPRIEADILASEKVRTLRSRR